MSLSISSYYYKSKSKKLDETLISRIEEIIEEFDGYGYRRTTAQLHREGFNVVNHKKILRIMQEKGLLRKPKHRYIRTTNSNHVYKVYPNLLKECTVTEINQIWCADITYIRVLNGALLNQHGFNINMARKGNPYDNAVAESFIKALKTEEVYLWESIPLLMWGRDFHIS